MLSVNAIYDGNTLVLLDDVEVKKPQRVIVTFLAEADDEPTAHELHHLAQQGGGLAFLEDEREDVYTDEHLKVKFR